MKESVKERKRFLTVGNVSFLNDTYFTKEKWN